MLEAAVRRRNQRRGVAARPGAAALAAAAIVLAAAVLACAPREGTTPVTDEMRAAARVVIERGEMPDWRTWELESTERGVRYIDLVPGTGRRPDWGNTVRVHYHLWLTDGTLVDSSLENDATPFEFEVGEGRVVPGWENVVRHLRAGGEYLIVVPPELGYGRRGSRTVPGNATLVFYLEIIGVR